MPGNASRATLKQLVAASDLFRSVEFNITWSPFLQGVVPLVRGAVFEILPAASTLTVALGEVVAPGLAPPLPPVTVSFGPQLKK